MSIENILRCLCGTSGVSGYEENTSDMFAELARPFCGEIVHDALGNLCAIREGEAGRKSVMIEAHADKIGLMVRHITEDGFVLFSEIGGFDAKVLPASRVYIYGKDKVEGVISSVPPHLHKKDVPFKSEELCIDTGFSKARLEEKVRVGDTIEIAADYTSLIGSRAASSAFDDRAGLAVLIRTLEKLEGVECGKVMAVCSTQEEVGLRGAPAAAYNLQPDLYVCVDVCHGKTPDASDNVFKLGEGVVITVGPNVQRYMSDRLINAAKKAEIPFQIDVDSGPTGTNAWTVQVARKGIPTALLSIPLRYMHTPYEVVSADDIEYTASLLYEFIRDGGEYA